MTDIEKLNEVIEVLGGRVKVCKRIGVTEPALHYWLAGKADLPARRALQLAKLSDFTVSVYDLRPDLKEDA